MNNTKVMCTLIAIAACLSSCSDNTQSVNNRSSAGTSSTWINTAGNASTGGAASSTLATAGVFATSTNSKAGSSSTGGASTGTGGTLKGGSTSTSGVECELIQCLRPIECVAKCGGPVLQSGCCACPNGSFDTLQCSGGGGSAPVGGATGAAGARSTGGRSASGGTSAKAGASSNGGSTAHAGASAQMECRSATDCQVLGDCCGCHALSKNQPSTCTLPCPNTATCSDFSPSPSVQCMAGQCVLDRSCNDSRVTCRRATPECPAGKMPSLTPDGSCWDGNCIDIVDCVEVPSCDVCKSNGLMCVYANGVRGVAHCVPIAYECQGVSNCSCFGSLCGSVSPCNDIPTGISCGGG